MHREICPVEIRVAINKKTTRFRNTGLKVKKRRKDNHTCSAMFIASGENIAQALMLRLLQPFHRMLVTRESPSDWLKDTIAFFMSPVMPVQFIPSHICLGRL